VLVKSDELSEILWSSGMFNTLLMHRQGILMRESLQNLYLDDSISGRHERQGLNVIVNHSSSRFLVFLKYSQVLQNVVPLSASLNVSESLESRFLSDSG
jgi:hypothetical protein